MNLSKDIKTLWLIGLILGTMSEEGLAYSWGFHPIKSRVLLSLDTKYPRWYGICLYKPLILNILVIIPWLICVQDFWEYMSQLTLALDRYS